MKQTHIPVHEFLIDWDSNNRNEVEKAKLLYQQARRVKRSIFFTDTGLIVPCFKPEHEAYLVKKSALSDSQFEMRILDETGDRLIVWDSENHQEVQDAYKMFKEYLDKGWRAYAIGDGGKKTKRIFSFDPETEEIHFDEKKSVLEKLSSFARNFKEIQMTPATRPGRELCH
jgi:hypothetical protein